MYIQTGGVRGSILQRDLDGGGKPDKLNLSVNNPPFTFPQRNAFPPVVTEPCFLTLSRTLALLALHDGPLGALPAVLVPALCPGEAAQGWTQHQIAHPPTRGAGRGARGGDWGGKNLRFCAKHRKYAGACEGG